MSFFNLDIPNDYSSRFKKLLADDIYQKNPITGLFERVGTGGGSPGELPYYLKPTDIEMNNFVTNTGTILNDSSLVIGDETGNETLTKEKIKILSQFKTKLIDPVNYNYGKFLFGYNSTTKSIEKMDQFYIGSASQNTFMGGSTITMTSNSGTNQITLASSSIYIKNPLGPDLLFFNYNNFKINDSLWNDIVNITTDTTDYPFLVAYDKVNNKFLRAKTFNLGTTNTNAQYGTTGVVLNNFASKVELYWNLLRFTASGISYDLKKDDIATLNNLNTLAFNGAPGTGETMVIYNNVTKKYSYTYFPGGGGAAFAYLLTNSIEMAANQYVKCSQGGNNISLKNGNIIVNTSTKPEVTLDYNTLKNIPKRTSYVLNLLSDWTYAPYSTVSGGSVTTAIKIPNFDLNCIGDNVYIRMSPYDDINLDTAGSGGLKAFIFTCPYLEKASYNSRVKFEIKHLNPDSGDEAVIQYIFPVIVTNSGRTKKCFAFSAQINTFLGGTIRIKLLEYPFAVYDDVLTAVPFPSAAV